MYFKYGYVSKRSNYTETTKHIFISVLFLIFFFKLALVITSRYITMCIKTDYYRTHVITFIA